MSALYVEVFRNAVRCARDAHTWVNEWELDKARKEGAKVRDRRTIQNFMKFAPSTPVVYQALAESHGLLAPNVQAALSEFYFRLELVSFDVSRFSQSKWDELMDPSNTEHFARTLYNACVPGREAINELRQGLEGYADLDLKLNLTCMDIFEWPTPLGKTFDEVLDASIKFGADKGI
ncbi:MAG TPA: hypothetical protein DCG48_08620 [Rhodospirillaceae bacterium]|nr:hypothetical protein [Rhodospirillaceae bacterium]